MVVNMSNRADARNLSRESRTLGHKRIVHALWIKQWFDKHRLSTVGKSLRAIVYDIPPQLIVSVDRTTSASETFRPIMMLYCLSLYLIW